MRRGRGQFAIGPDGAVGEVFFFPDGDGALQRVDGEAAGVEGGGAMGSADGDEDAGFSNFEAAKAVRYGDAIDGEFLMNAGGDFFQLLQRHGFVRFVVEVERAATVRIVANAAVESNDGAIGISANVVDKRGGIDRVVAELDEVVGGSGGHFARVRCAPQPPLTGGRKATSSPGWSGVDQEANSRLREAAIALRCSAKRG